MEVGTAPTLRTKAVWMSVDTSLGITTPLSRQMDFANTQACLSLTLLIYLKGSIVGHSDPSALTECFPCWF